MRPFSEARKVKSSTSLSQKCKIIANICEHCGIVHSFGLSFILNTQKTAILDFPRSSDSRWIIVRRSWLNSFSVIRGCPRWYDLGTTVGKGGGDGRFWNWITCRNNRLVWVWLFFCFVLFFHIKSVNVFPVKECNVLPKYQSHAQYKWTEHNRHPCSALPAWYAKFLRRDRWKMFKLILPPVVRSENRPLIRRFLGTQGAGSNREEICVQWTGRTEFPEKNEVARFSRDLRRLETEQLTPESPTFSSFLRGQTTNRVIRPSRL